MTTFHYAISLGPRDGSRFQRVMAAVGTASTHTVMPAPLLTMLGVDPQWTDLFETADGERQERSLAEVSIIVDDRQRTTICIFGDSDSQPVLGKLALDSLGLAVDLTNRKLVPARLFME